MRPEQERALAAKALHKALKKRRTTDQLLPDLPTPLARELLFGALRRYLTLERSLRPLLKTPLRAKDHDLWCLMIVGAYQLEHSRVPDHAAVATTVGACAPLGKPWAKGLVNGVLRSFTRQSERSFGMQDEFPDWLVARLRTDYPKQWQDILGASLARAPQALRINALRCSTAQYAKQLDTHGYAHQPGFTEAQLVLESPVPVAELPGYGRGLVSIQDAGAGLVTALLAPKPGSRLRGTRRQTLRNVRSVPGHGHPYRAGASPSQG